MDIPECQKLWKVTAPEIGWVGKSGSFAHFTAYYAKG